MVPPRSPLLGDLSEVFARSTQQLGKAEWGKDVYSEQAGIGTK